MMEMHRDRHWFEDNNWAIGPRASNEPDKLLLPNKVIAEYDTGDNIKSAIYWTAHERADMQSLEVHSIHDPFVYDPSPLVWVASNTDELYKHYPNQWILVEKNVVIGHSENPLEVAALAEQRGIEAAFITKVVASSKPTKMLYAGQVI